VGILTATPESQLDVRGLIAVRGTPTFPTTGVGAELFYSSSNSNSNLYSYNRATSAWVEMAYGASSHKFEIGGGTAMTLNSSGNLAFVSGKGIDFSANTPDGSGTVGSEVLNDYEEGTFTPTIVGSTSAGTGTYVSQTGRYTKIGNQVTVWIYFNWTAHTGTGDMSVNGLPFTIENLAGNYPAPSFGLVENIALTAGKYLGGYGNLNSTKIIFLQYPTGGGAIAGVPIDSAAEVSLTMTYRV
jgi:hypothetical protein